MSGMQCSLPSLRTGHIGRVVTFKHVKGMVVDYKIQKNLYIAVICKKMRAFRLELIPIIYM